MNGITMIWLANLATLGSILFSYYVLMYKASKRKPWHKKDLNYQPYISVIIPTYDEEKNILRKMENIFDQSFPREKMEVVVVDGNSPDETQETVRKFIKEHKELKIKLIAEEERRGKSKAMNEALQYCKGNIIVISDADAFLQRDALKHLIANFADLTIGGVTAMKVPMKATDDKMKAEETYRSLYNMFRVGESNLYSTPIFHGELSAFRRRALKRFNLTCDDSGTALEIAKQGYRIIEDSEATVYEDPPQGLRDWFKWRARRGRAIIEVMWAYIREFSQFNETFKLIILYNFLLHAVTPLLILTLLIILPSVFMDNVTLLLFVALLVSIFLIIPRLRIVAAIGWSFINNQLILPYSLFLYLKGEKYVLWQRPR